jgi:tetratricopeptide (TPR) repeat protein
MSVSSVRITSRKIVVFLALAGAGANALPQAASESVGDARVTEKTAADPAAVFQHGQLALQDNRLAEAERDFRQVLQMDPRAGAAYANLGVVYMRRKQWDRALQSLEKAQELMPKVAGIRLNIGLVYYRQNAFLKAIPAFESVVREQPEALQARYLLGLCYFFAERWADATAMLEPLWAQQSDKFPYLYVLANAANRAGRADLDERASAQLLKIGNDTAEYHLFAGKYHLNREEYDMAIAEFKSAAKSDPRLTFVHFNLGWAYLKKQQYAEARDEFLKDVAIEPDLALNYDELGEVYWQMQDDANAEKSFREAIRRDPRLVSSHLGLAKIYQKQQKYTAALAEADRAVKLDPERTEAHYLRGQALLRLGRKEEAKKELGAAAGGTKKEGSVPSPELMQDAQ